MKCAVIAGNAPSLKQIDYSLMPEDYDVFRCNQFYFEEQYFLGKKVKGVCFATQMAFEQIYTMLHLHAKGEYEIEHIFLRDLICPNQSQEHKMVQALLEYFNDDVFIHGIYQSHHAQHIKAFLEFIKMREIYFYEHITTGILLCAIATAMGYKEIYLAGIDFYESREVYAFDTLQNNLLKLAPEFEFVIHHSKKKSFNFLRNHKTYPYHSKNADLEALKFLSKHYGVQFYSLCPTSPISNYLKLPPKNQTSFSPIPKPPCFTKDILIPPQYAYHKMGLNKQKPLDPPKEKTSKFFSWLKRLWFCPPPHR